MGSKKVVKKVAKLEDAVTDHVTRQPVPATDIQDWVEPFPATGKVRVLVVANDGINIPMVHGEKFRNFAVPKGSEVILDADVAHSLHRSIAAVPRKED